MSKVLDRISVGTRVNVTVSEPWELVTAMASPKLVGSITSVKGEAAAVICLDQEILSVNAPYRYFLAQPRHVGDCFGGNSKTLFCTLISMGESEWEHGVPANLSSFRGKVMLLADVAW